MKAAVVHEFGGPLVVEEVATPVPEQGQVLVRVETSGFVPHRHPRRTR